jgi:hypothetical protein
MSFRHKVGIGGKGRGCQGRPRFGTSSLGTACVIECGSELDCAGVGTEFWIEP